MHTRAFIGVLLLWCMWATPAPGRAQVRDTPVLSDQRAAMHSSSREDTATHINAPRYVITGTITPQNHSLTATQTLFYVNETDTTLDRLYFRLLPNLRDMGGKLVINAARIGEQAVPFVLEANNYLVRIDLPTPLLHGSALVVALDFVTTMPFNKGRELYGAMNDDGQTLALASAYPLLANVVNGAWEIDIPDTKGDLVNSPVAWYDVTLTAPRTHSIVTTGTTTSLTRDATTQTVHIVSGLQRDFTIAATTLPRISTTIDGTQLNVYYPAGNIRGGRLALTFAKQALHVYNTRIGQYPYNELDIVAVDAGTFYGVEYPGFTFIERRLFDKPGFLESIIAHEVAHQWFYGVIGNDVQQHAWVDESLATYAQYIYREAVWSPTDAMLEANDWKERYARLKTRNADGPIDRHMRDFTLYSYNVIAYDKAALYVAALRTQVGDTAFFAALQRYYSDNRYGYVDGRALVDAVQRSCACDVQPIYNQWVLGQ